MKRKWVITAIIFSLCAVVIGALAHRADKKGVTINGVHVELSELNNYRTKVELNMAVPDVITDGTDEMKHCVHWMIDERYDLNIKTLKKRGYVYGIVAPFTKYEPILMPVSYIIDEERLRGLLEEMNSSLPETTNAYIDMETYEVVPEVYGEQIDIDMAIYAIHEAADAGESITLSSFVIKPTVLTENLQAGVNEYRKHKNWTVYYDDADITLTVPDEALELTNDGRFEIVSYDFIDECVKAVASSYSTVGTTHSFTTHDGNVITVFGGTFGNRIDKGSERDELVALFEEGTSSESRAPVYSTYINDGFDTYVEVSLDDQHVWFYEGGELIMDSPCVSGTKDTTRETPTGFWYMDIVTPGKTLYPSGEENGTWVDRWMRFSPDGCGLHDASWRDVFGGDIYTYNGSHGCVNLPPKFAFDLYEHAYVGMPVIVY